MNIDKYEEKLSKDVIIPLIEMLKEDEFCDYKKCHVRKCKKLVHGYLRALGRMSEPTDEKIMKQVEILVLALNNLNEKTEYALLETDEREIICEIIRESAVECGLQEASYDITEEWREW